MLFVSVINIIYVLSYIYIIFFLVLGIVDIWEIYNKIYQRASKGKILKNVLSHTCNHLQGEKNEQLYVINSIDIMTPLVRKDNKLKFHKVHKIRSYLYLPIN